MITKKTICAHVNNPPRFVASGQYANLKPRRIDALARIAENGLDGAQWYQTAQSEIEEVCKREQWNPQTFTDVLAILSPRVAVRRNIRNALQWFGTGEPFRNTLSKIRAAVETYHETGIVSGPKVGPFARALQGDENAIVLDVHIANALRVPQSAFGIAIVRHRCESQILKLANRFGLSPREAQAVLWFGQFRTLNRKPESFPILSEYANFLSHNRRFPQTGAISAK